MTRVLIAENSTHMRVILRDILVRSGYDVVGDAKDGRTAVELCASLKPDIVALDVSIRDNDYLVTLKAIKSIERFKAPVVMISSIGQQNNVIEALRAGAVDFIIKPFQAERVVETIENALR
ncbi:MAG: response regulator [Synergistaceae bacterium]|nr:response regulator [Synergistaceae bacterium]